MTQQKALDLFTIPAPRISWARYEQLQELQFSKVGTMPNMSSRFKTPALTTVKEKSNRQPVALQCHRATPPAQQAVGLFPWAMVCCACGPLTCSSLSSCICFYWMMLVCKNILSPSYHLHFENRLHCCVLCDEMNKTRPNLHMFWQYL